MKQKFKHVRSWIFDLDNTLYPPTARLFDQMDGLMTAWIMRELDVDEAEALSMRKDYLARYGTTLGGLIKHHAIAPDGFLHETHELDLSHLTPVPDLRTQIEALPGRRVIFTNGSRRHAQRVTQALGLNGIFDAMYGIEDSQYASKPQPQAFERVFLTEGLDPTLSAMFEDMPENLHVPHRLGMRTVLVSPDEVELPAHIHHLTDDLAGFLSRING